MPPAAGTALSIAQDFNALALTASNILADPNRVLSNAQTTTLQSSSTSLTNYATAFADGAAWSALAAAQPDLDAMKQATTAANAKAKSLAQQAAQLNRILAILGAAISLGADIATANLAGAVTDATNLAAASV
jgi:hypothetical protein